jgi:purine-binding chemotaxis protein CheW
VRRQGVAVAAPEEGHADFGRITNAAADAMSTTEHIEFISFAIGDAQFGVDIMAVREIREWSNVTPLPKQPDYVRGVLNLRGVVMPVVDLRCRFGQGLTEPTPTHIIIIVQIGERQVGLLADRVLDIVSFETGKIQPVPNVAQSARTLFLSGLVTVDGAMIALIDLDNLLSVQIDIDDGVAVPNTEPTASENH